MSRILILLVLSFLIPHSVDGKPDRRSMLDRATRGLVHIEARGGNGSGFFIDKGLIMTNAHVVKDYKRVSCMLYNKEKVTGKIVGKDDMMDIALIRIDLEDLEDEKYPVILKARETPVMPGDDVIAMGSPHGESRSLTKGIISNVDRYLAPLPINSGALSGVFNNFIQTDASINPGNSGGPLIDDNGDVVGVNTRGSLIAENMGFSIPIMHALKAKNRILKFENSETKIQHKMLGVELSPHDPDNSDHPYGYAAEFGVRVTLLHQDAESCPLLKNDIITHVNGKEVNCKTQSELPAALALIDEDASSEKVKLKILRKKESLELEVTCIDPEVFHMPVFMRIWGVYVRKPYQNEQRHCRGGVVMHANKTMNMFHFKNGDLITKIDGVTMKDFGELVKLGQNTREINDKTTITVIRNKQEVSLSLGNMFR